MYIKDAIEKFTGAGRRFEILAEIDGITIADDYAHHPAELAVTLNAAKEMGLIELKNSVESMSFDAQLRILEEITKRFSIDMISYTFNIESFIKTLL